MLRPVFLIVVLLAGCAPASAPEASQSVTPPLAPLATTTPGMVPPQTTAPPQNTDDWTAGSHGIELRQIQLAATSERPTTTLVITRIDPSQVRLRVAYAPDQPRYLHEWVASNTPLAIINGGFFDQEYRATALVIHDGVVSGSSYEGFGGMLAVTTDDVVSIRPLRDESYDPDEALAQGMQSFPMLVFPGGVAATLDENGERARRTAVALDQQGRLLLISCTTSSLSLSEFATWLAESDLGIDRALNMDGGSSTGMIVNAGAAKINIPSFGPLPLVLMIEEP